MRQPRCKYTFTFTRREELRTRDVLEMSTVLEPRTTSRNVISCYETMSASQLVIHHNERILTALALNLDQHWQILRGLAIPRSERLQEL